MRILATDTKTLPALYLREPNRLGFLLTPRSAHAPAWVAATFPGAWACDNDAYSGFDPARYRRLLSAITAASVRPLWVTAPDVVADASATLRLWSEWSPVLRDAGVPAAFALQDGLKSLPEADAYFVGGSTEWKLGPVAAELISEAKSWGKWVHMGRVSTLRRLERAYLLKCDSVDSSIYSRQPAKWLPLGLKWLRRVERQPRLWDESGAAA